ncbi:diacylglycerol kinase family protein [Sphingomonas naphthae]|uniref:Diacylglycerol kinase family protein n=1 Tax=Sphingomonas naphthae TaxID=1813468 RepID=A0ABY7TJQ0_9SPHN|nr:diacylglycerol kinase family protein [Sphingomonas naphthae]WCT73447.1 diacylglycerol kinase family protein [Sphingomonas naphthae]
MSDLPRSAVLIVNAKARRGQKLFREACTKLKAAGIDLIATHALTDPDQLVPTVKQAVADGAPMVIVGGGDGSLSSSVDYLVGTDCVFALLPFGTANSFARSLCIPLDIDGAIDVIATGQRRRIDLGMIDGDYYANCAAIGISPLIAQTVPHNLKKVAGRPGYLTWAAIQSFRFKPFHLIVDDGHTRSETEALEVRIANGAYHGGTELVDAQVDSGEIVVQVVVGKVKRRLAWSWLLAILRHRSMKDTVVEYRGREMRIETIPPLPISIDGEVTVNTPVTAKVARGVIEVAAPRDEQEDCPV